MTFPTTDQVLSARKLGAAFRDGAFVAPAEAGGLIIGAVCPETGEVSCFAPDNLTAADERLIDRLAALSA